MTKLIPLDAVIAALDRHAHGTTTLGGQTYRSITLGVAVDALHALPTIDLAAIREAALREAETVVRQALVDAAYVYGSEPMKAKSAMFKAAVYATNAILALIGEKK